MKINRVICATIVLWLSLAIIISPAWAGHRHHGRHHFGGYSHGGYYHNGYFWEGLAIGIGVAVLGDILTSPGYYYAPTPQVSTYSYAPPARRGHWGLKRIWHRPFMEQERSPGYYDRWGRWVPEMWVTVHRQPGYWTEEEVWIP